MKDTSTKTQASSQMEELDQESVDDDMESKGGAGQNIPAVEMDTRNKKTWPEVPLEVKRPSTWWRAIYGKWSYSYMDPILKKGRRQFKSKEHLEMSDLFQVPSDMHSRSLVTKFR